MLISGTFCCQVKNVKNLTLHQPRPRGTTVYWLTLTGPHDQKTIRHNVMANLDSILSARHIQNMSDAAQFEPHWGYADRALPCTNDKGSCEFLDLV
ncbi:hypothetical protein J3F83DRAFT_385348 [Trichoderma novae-zelandiae]